MEYSPSITLRKGKTEIKIENAAAVIKKINEMYPARVEYDGWYYAPSWNKKQKRTEAEIERQRQWIESAKDWFKNEMFNGTGSFEVVVSDPEPPKIIETKEELVEHIKSFVPPKFQKLQEPELKSAPESTEPLMVQSVNKNAYEIRLEILKEAIHWMSIAGITPISVPGGEAIIPTENQKNGDDVITLAKKFYSFVENRRY